MHLRPPPLIVPPQDLRNHGESPHDPRHDYTALAEDVEGFLQEHKIERPALIGHSMYVLHTHTKPRYDKWMLTADKGC